MIKVFTANKNGKIEISTEELKKILDEAYWEGYRDNNKSWIYSTTNYGGYIFTSASNATTNSSGGKYD